MTSHYVCTFCATHPVQTVHGYNSAWLNLCPFKINSNARFGYFRARYNSLKFSRDEIYGDGKRVQGATDTG